MLKQYQDQLLDRIMQPSVDCNEPANLSERTGLAIYQNNYLASLNRSLANSFPAIDALLQDNFPIAAKHYGNKVMRTNPDWAEIGKHFAHYLGNEEALSSLPYIEPLAELEYALFMAERAKDKALALESLSLLEQEPAEQLTPIWAPGLVLITSTYPLLTIYECLLNDEQTKLNIVLQQVALTPPDQITPYCFAVYRQGTKAKVLPIADELVLYYQQLINSHSIEEALSNVTATINLSAWLGHAIENQLLLGIERR